MHIHFIIHEHFEAPGAYEIWGKSRGCSLSYTRVYQGEPLPEELGGTDLLIIMGGPRNPPPPRLRNAPGLMRRRKRHSSAAR